MPVTGSEHNRPKPAARRVDLRISKPKFKINVRRIRAGAYLRDCVMLSYRHLPVGILAGFWELGLALAQPVPMPPGSESDAPQPEVPGVPNMSCGDAYSPQW